MRPTNAARPPPSATAALADAYHDGPGKRVSATGPVRPRPAGGAGFDLSTMSDDGSFAEAVVEVLLAALAPQRWEPWNPYNDHRAYPSPRSAFLVDTTLRIGSRRWRVDADRHRLVGVGRPSMAGLRAVAVELHVVPERLPDGYGSIRTALAALEAGHVAMALVAAAAAGGLLGGVVMTPHGLSTTLIAEVTLTMGPDVGRSQVRGAIARSAGFGPFGLSADLRPLPATTLRDMLGSLPGLATDVPVLGRFGDLLRHRIAVRSVAGYVDGWYEPRPDGPGLIRANGAIDDIGPTLVNPLSAIDVAGMNIAWVMTADLAAATRDVGPHAYLRLLFTAGAVAQRVCTVAATAGLFCRPMRSVREDAIEAVTRAPAGHDFVYLLLAGRQRCAGPSYDLRPPGPRSRS